MEAEARTTAEGYVVESVRRACELLGAFRYEGEVLRLKDLASRTGLSGATAFRILYTLQQEGLVERVGDKEYRSAVKLPRARRFRIGYTYGQDSPGFLQEWNDSIIRAAAEHGVELVVRQHGREPDAPLRSAAQLIKERVDLVIDYQSDLAVASATAAALAEAGIPLIAMGTPRPRAVYYGPNNYAAGAMGGRHLARWARREWHDAGYELILLDISVAGPVIQMRMKGFEAGVRQIRPDLPERSIVRLGGSVRFEDCLELVRAHIRRMPARKVLLGAAFDHGGLAALRAMEEAGRSEDCAVGALGGTVEGRMELRRPGTRLLGDVAFFLDRYGEDVLGLAIALLEKRPVPPALFAKHVVLTPQNVDQYYPNDCLLHPSAGLPLSA